MKKLSIIGIFLLASTALFAQQGRGMQSERPNQGKNQGYERQMGQGWSQEIEVSGKLSLKDGSLPSMISKGKTYFIALSPEAITELGLNTGTTIKVEGTLIEDCRLSYSENDSAQYIRPRSIEFDGKTLVRSMGHNGRGRNNKGCRR